MEQFLKVAQGRIEDWSKINGPIKVGNTKYGWAKNIKEKVDVPYVFNVLLENNVPVEEWGRLASVSKTSISRLPKKQYEDVRELLDTFAITSSEGKPTFKELKQT